MCKLTSLATALLSLFLLWAPANAYEAINGLAMMAASTLVFDVLKLAD